MVKDQITWLVREAAQRAQDKGDLPGIALPDVSLEHPQNPAFGDYASSLPLKLARAARTSPMVIAQRIVDNLAPADYIAKVEVAAPGFINFTLSDQWVAQQVDTIVKAGPRYGNVDIGNGLKAQVEFGSANPTGPLTAATGRGGALGDALANILAAAGYQVEREYYVNDAGSRMEAFYQTIYARYAQQFGLPAEVPADGYHGAYMVDLAKEMVAEYGDRFLKVPEAEAAATLGRMALDRMVESARSDLKAMGIEYDVWFSEQSLFERNLVEQTLYSLQERGYIDRREGAIWFSSAALGEDKDNVLIRSNGIPTYFATDIAYHYDKLVLRGFDWVIDIWGADHQGHVPRMKAAVAALGIPPERLTLVIHQMITLRRGDEVVRMSKRTGDIVTLREVLEEVGADAARFFFLSRSAESHMDFDLELAKQQSAENPVYYVQYAHARIASILKYAGDIDTGDADLTLLKTEPELALIKKMLWLPELVENAARKLEPHHLPYYAQDLAAIFHSFYNHCRVVSEDVALTKARLRLVQAAKITLANTLGLMGVTAPEQM